MEKDNSIRVETLLNDGKVKTISPSFKLSNNEMMDDGITVVISQDKEYSVGFTNRVDKKLQNPPYIVFGDHTECFKWVETPFAQGADGVRILKSNSNEVLDRYLYYALLSCYNKTGFYERHFKLLRKTFIPNLNINKQQKIVAILSKYDQLIENNNKRIKILEQMAENLYKEWFIRFRFPGYKNTEFENGIPKEWTYFKFSDLYKCERGISYSTEEIEVEEGENLINLKNIQSFGGFRRDGLKKYNGKYREQQKVSYNDLVMGVTDMTQDRRTVGAVALIPKINGVISADLVKLTSKINNIFSYCLFRFGFYSKLFSQFGNGANVIHLKPSSIKNQKILIPTQKLVDLFVKNVETLIEEIENLNLVNDNLAKQRDSLLPRLMSGKLEIK